MMLSQFEEAVWHRRSSECDVAEPWHHSGEIVSPVEAVFEFGEVVAALKPERTSPHDQKKLSSEIAGEVCPEETRGLLLLDNDVPRAGRDHSNDLVAVAPAVDRGGCLVATRALPSPAAAVPIVRPPF